MRVILACVGVLLMVGCAAKPPRRSAAEVDMFGPASMRIHPIFTQVKDWTGDGEPDGIEALIEFGDRFGDPTKASGTVVFELYSYRQADPDPRDTRLAYWTGSILSLEDQRVRWNRTSRTYGFQLAFPSISTQRSYVLVATVQPPVGGRFFDQVVLEAVPEPTREPSTKPATQPATQTGRQPVTP